VTASLEILAGLQSDCLWTLTKFIVDESGQDMIEYALIAASIGLSTIAGVNGLAASISRYMNIVGAGFDSAVSGI
jgi:pilus assembly protein Flp/PilA